MDSAFFISLTEQYCRSDNKITPEQALASWNTRAPEPLVKERLQEIDSLKAQLKGMSDTLYDEVKTRQKWQERAIELEAQLDVNR